MRPDASHAGLQADFAAALWAAEPPSGLTAPDPAEIAQRFKVYRNNVLHSLTRALAARFPVVEQLVGAAFFAAMARVYSAKSPPDTPVMLNWGADFTDFLTNFPPVAHLPFLGDVARLEYARGQACHAADAVAISPEALGQFDPHALRLRLHPSVTLFAAVQPAVQIWRAHQPGAPRPPLQPGPDHALIARDPDFTVIVAQVPHATYAVLLALQTGETLGDAATIADPTDALTLLLRHGLITEAGETR